MPTGIKIPFFFQLWSVLKSTWKNLAVSSLVNSSGWLFWDWSKLLCDLAGSLKFISLILNGFSNPFSCLLS